MAGKVRPSEIFIFDNYCEISIKDRNGVEKHRAIIDRDDYDKVKNYRWHSNDKNYVGTWYNGKIISLHRMLMKFPKEMIDHKNQNPLDNRKNNLQVCNASENRINAKLSNHNTSGINGVFLRPNGKWQASIIVNKKKIYLAETFNKNLAIKRKVEAEKKYYPNFCRDYSGDSIG